MKKLLVLILLTVAGSASAQFTKGSWEMGLMGSISNVDIESYDFHQSQTVFNISVSPAYYVIDGLSLEPEIAFFFNFDNADNPGYQLLLNAGYTFKSTKSFSPYIKAGYGFGNILTINFSGTQSVPTGNTKNEEESLAIVNAGVGIKWLLGGSAAIKTELNYHNQNLSSELLNTEDQYRNIGLLLGLSVFL
jgi:opacity protein-like surface antigen